MSSFLELNFHEIKGTALVLKALDDQLRQKIMLFIYEQEEVNITEVYTHFRLEQSIASQNLAKLRRAGILITERREKRIYYRIDPDRIKVIGRAISMIKRNQID